MTEEEKKEFEEFLQWKAEKAKKENAEKSKEEVTENSTEEKNHQDTTPSKENVKIGNIDNKKHYDTLEDQNKKIFKGCGIAALVFIVICLLASILGSKNDNAGQASAVSDTTSTSSEADSTANNAEKEQALKQKEWNDSVIKADKAFFTVKKDEYSDKSWVQPLNRPKYTNQNSICCYFEKEGDEVSNFRFRFQYAADDWLFIQSIIFNCDGKNITYVPENVDRDNNETIWEWFDEQVTQEDVPLIDAIANANKVKMKINGQQYYTTKVLTKDQIKSIKRTYNYYKALGGTFPEY